MLHLPLIIRQARRSSRQAVLFVLCVALSLTALTAFSGFSASVSRALLADARALHAADIIIASYDPISEPVDRAIQALVQNRKAVRADIHEFFSVVRAAHEQRSVLAGIKVVDPGYPFYGEVVTGSGRPLGSVLSPGRVVVEQSLLDRTGLKIGDPLTVGHITLTIADVVVSEQDRAFNFFSIGPRVFVNARDLKALGLMETGSRIRRKVLLKVPDDKQIDAIAARLKQVALPDQEQVDTFATAGSRAKRFLDNFFFFLKLVGLFILLMAGLGMQGTLSALLRENRPTIAIMKTCGASNTYITRYFAGLLALLGTVGTAAGLLCGIGLQRVLGRIMGPFLPNHLGLSIGWQGVVQGAVLGFGVVVLFSFLPMAGIRETRPMALFKREPHRPSKRWPAVLNIVLIFSFFLALVIWHMRDLRFGVYFVASISGLVLLSALLSRLLLYLLSRRPAPYLVLRQAVKGLFRQGGATRSIITTLTASLAIIFANYLIERNLDATFVQSYPADAPNAFFVDIQPDQAEAFTNLIGRKTELYPIVRARVTAVNGEAIDRSRERRQRRDNLSRVFNLTYRRHLLDDEVLIKGRQLFRPDWDGLQVSVLDTVVEMRPMSIGDSIAFNIQGVPLKARISSIRSRTQSSFRPFFYFVFPDEALRQAPQTLFAAVNIAPQELGALQNRVVERFPNISVIDMSQAIGIFTALMNRMSRIIRTFSLFSIAAGLLILLSAIFATRAARVRESVYYKVMGAGTGFVFKVFALENLLLGLQSGSLALLMAQAGAFWVCTAKLNIGYRPFLLDSGAMIAATLLLITAVGLAASRSIMKKKPVIYLREQPDG